MARPADAKSLVLVVEDEPDFAALLEAMLRKADLEVVVAGDGAAALERVREQAPDLITLDIQMPGKSGLLFYRQLKSNDDWRSIPVIVVTGLTRDDPDTKAFVHTFLEPDHLPRPDAYLEKPVSRASLLGAVDDALGRAQRARHAS